jgi:hypothetical protein
MTPPVPILLTTCDETVMPRIFLTFDGDIEGDRLINLGAGVEPTDAVNKAQLDAGLGGKLDRAEKGQANGIATLDASGKVLSAQIPPLAYVPTAEKGKPGGVATLDASGKVPSGQLPAAAAPTIALSGTDHGAWIDLNNTSEQMLRVPHGRGTVPPEREVFFEPVADVDLDVDAVCLEHIKYLAGQSNANEMVFAVKLREGSGTAGQRGQLRVLTFAG